ncbi:MAG: energy transducer TonB, partial [Gammaproteobacteria bacterium]
MIPTHRKAGACLTWIMSAGLLAAVAGPLRAEESVSPANPARPVDFHTCAKPEWPKADLRAGHTGAVTIRFLVSADGTVTDSKIVQSSGYDSLDQAARNALATCRFAPASDPGATATWL